MLENRSFSPSNEFGTASQLCKARIDAFLYRYNRSGHIEIILRENRFPGENQALLQMFSKDLPDHRDCNGSTAIRVMENFGVLGSDFKPRRLTEVEFKVERGMTSAIYAAEITDPDQFRVEKLLDVLYSSSEEERIRILPLAFLLDERALRLMRHPEQIEGLKYLSKLAKHLKADGPEAKL